MQYNKRRILPYRLNPIASILGVSALVAFSVNATDLTVSSKSQQPQLEHITQAELNALVDSDPHEAFITAFEVGDEIFEIEANELDGVGANVGNGERFSKVPRMDLDGSEEWASHIPARDTGPNGQACTECHLKPFADGAGPIAGNNVRDPLRTGDISDFITRQPPHVFGIGAKQLLAEEMTADLHAIRDLASQRARNRNEAITRTLLTKGVKFGKIIAKPNGDFDFSLLDGVDEDLVVKPLQWKGVEPTIRSFVRGAENNEIGLQAKELVGAGNDNDFDGVVDELGVGDITALAIYQAGQPRPVTKIELASYGLMDLSRADKMAILSGESLFHQAKCDTCHKPTLYLDDPVFSEPSQRETHRDEMFPSGDNPVLMGLSPEKAITFDLTKDMPDNLMTLADGRKVHLGNFQKDRYGKTIVNIFSDLKRHDLGPGIAESVDEKDTGHSVFITQPLWGAGSTAPYMHDGRSPTIADAIMWHGGDAANSRRAFKRLSAQDQQALIAYVENNILLLAEEEEGEEAEGGHSDLFDLSKEKEDLFGF